MDRAEFLIELMQALTENEGGVVRVKSIMAIDELVHPLITDSEKLPSVIRELNIANAENEELSQEVKDLKAEKKSLELNLEDCRKTRLKDLYVFCSKCNKEFDFLSLKDDLKKGNVRTKQCPVCRNQSLQIGLRNEENIKQQDEKTVVKVENVLKPEHYEIRYPSKTLIVYVEPTIYGEEWVMQIHLKEGGHKLAFKEFPNFKPKFKEFPNPKPKTDICPNAEFKKNHDALFCKLNNMTTTKSCTNGNWKACYALGGEDNDERE
jgi:hypothetical protein